MEFPFPESLRGKLEPRALVGAGGMGVVFLAHDLTLDREVAVKLVTGQLDEARQRRFLREAECLTRLRHPGVVEIYDFGEIPEGLYIAMEYVEGKPLSRGGDPRRVTEAMIQLAGILAAIHAEGLVHRDLKPENVLRTRDDRLVVIDFGLALEAEGTRLTGQGKVVGTVPYIAPEVLRDDLATPAADWYSWGVLFYELVEGRLPFTVPELWECTGGGSLPAPVFRRLGPLSTRRAVISAALSDDPAARPTSVSDVRAILEETARARRVANEEDDPLSMSASELQRFSNQEIDALRSKMRSEGESARTREESGARSDRSSRGHRSPFLRWRWTVVLMSFLAALLLGDGAVYLATRPGSEPSPPSAPGPHDSPERTEFCEVLERDFAHHRAPAGPIRTIGRGEPYASHLDETIEAFRDPRSTIRWRRILKAAARWILAALPRRLPPTGSRVRFPDPLDDDLTRWDLLPAIQHLRRDYRMLSIASNSILFGDGTGGYPAVTTTMDQSALLVAFRRLQELDRELTSFLREFPPLETLPDSVLALRILLYREGEDIAPMIEELDRRLADMSVETPDPWLLRAELSLYPSTSGRRSPMNCEPARTRLTGTRERVLAAALVLPPRERCGLLHEILYVQLSLLNSCRELSPAEQRTLVSGGSQILEMLEARPSPAPLETHAWCFWTLLIGNLTATGSAGDEALQELWPRVRALGEGALAAAQR